MFKAEYIFVRILIPFLFGISAFYSYPNLLISKLLAIITTLLFLLIITINISYKKLNGYRFKGVTGILILLFFFFFGGLVCLLKNETLKSDYFAKRHYTYLKVWVNDEPQQTNDILRFKASVVSGYENSRQIKLSGKLLVALKVNSAEPVHLKYGDELIISANYAPIEPPYNPAEFDFKRWMAAKNIRQQCFINQKNLLKTNRNIGNPIIRFALRLRKRQIEVYRQLIKDREAFSVASTLIFDYRADLSKETLAAYSTTGTIHALSVSGSHVGIIFFLLNICFAFLDKNKHLKILKFILICSLIWGYALITGLSPTVVRAAIMITIFIAALTFAKNKNGYNTLAFAAFCQLVYNPFLIWDVGFQLSYISVFGLIYLQPKIYKWLYMKNKWLDKVWQLIALSLAAQLVTFPLCLYYFHQFPVYFLLGNLFIAIPLTAIMILGMLVLVPYLHWLAPVFEWIIAFTNSTLKQIADLPYSTFSSVWITIPELILLILALSSLVYGLARYDKRFLAASLSIYIVYSSCTLYDDWQAMHQQKIIFFTLRKNYAAAFIKGQKAILVTDLSAGDRNYEFFVQPALAQSKITEIDFLNLQNDTASRNFLKTQSQIIFYNYHLLIIDASFNNKKLEAGGKFSALWITANTKFKLDNISKKVKYQSILIDGTNKDYHIAQFDNFAKNNSVEHHILKKNPAYLVYLNQ
ncbi:ComEC/Rec2 family competence protein [Pedobacter endophyticus]|uniref:ComEC family competence protein n=1 Tax=Pedobacter endophyticus TaxID=2789740 RepID=A0A7S9KZX7_9SPHI|nr:ComEC/Rec2 family competence protein [Pedobacter endophyticus]QPH39897.1 ComEC family competence protein [Pedobacter endophyticus]